MTDGWGSGEGVRLLLLCDTSIVITITAQDSPKVTHPQEDTRWQWTGTNRTGGLQDFRNGDRRWRQAGLLAHDTLWSPNEQLTQKGYGLH